MQETLPIGVSRAPQHMVVPNACDRRTVVLFLPAPVAAHPRPCHGLMVGGAYFPTLERWSWPGTCSLTKAEVCDGLPGQPRTCTAAGGAVSWPLQTELLCWAPKGGSCRRLRWLFQLGAQGVVMQSKSAFRC